MKVDHIAHLEDLLFTIHATRVPEILEGVLDHMFGVYTLDLSVKYDGSPSIVVGNDPKDGEFFVATKSVFNKKPVVYKSMEEISSIKNDGLKKVLSCVFIELRAHEFKYIIQGDLLWTKDTLEEIGPRPVLRFTPNTLTYQVPTNPELEAIVRGTDLGIAWHTCYKGSSLSELSAIDFVAVPPASRRVINVPTSIFLKDVYDHWLPKGRQLAEYRNRIELLKMSVSNSMNWPIRFIELAEVFFNDDRDCDFQQFLPRFASFISEFYDEEASDRKSQRGKDKVNEERIAMLSMLKLFYTEVWVLYCVYVEVVNLKLDLMSHFDASSAFMCLLPDGNATGQEGYVVKTDGIITKLVNRDVFTVYNRLNSPNNRRNK